jgi:K+ transporter
MIPKTGNRPASDPSLQALSLSALGVVFGDIGTSPLYTLKTVFALTGGKPDRAVILGTLSLVIWTLIIVAWSAMVFPSLLLNYTGQAALVLEGASTSENIFFRLCPPALLIPLVVLATIATIIASQSIITGAFSMTRQAIHVGWFPRLKVTQTSAEGYGQIYVGAVNWTLMIVTCGLALAFRKSDNLAAAYGIAVSATMLATSALLFNAMREI